MPQRFLRPGITSSRKWDGCAWITQSFYIRLLTLVDDFGRYEADAMLLRSHAFPLRDDITASQVSDMCAEMEANGLAKFYTNNGKQYVQITNWIEKPRAAKSKHPHFENICLQSENICSGSASKCSAPSSSSSSSSSSSPNSTNKQKGWPKMEEVEAYGGMRGLAKEVCEQFWHHFNASGWIDKNGHEVKSWQSKLMTWKAASQARPLEAAHRAAEGPGSAGTHSSHVTMSKEFERCLEAIRRIRDSVSRDAFGTALYTEAEKAKLKMLSARRDELKRSLGVVV